MIRNPNLALAENTLSEECHGRSIRSALGLLVGLFAIILPGRRYGYKQKSRRSCHDSGAQQTAADLWHP
jgi:hypothetical protein